MNNCIWILGAPDPEMNRIEEILIGAGECVAHAIVLPEARRVRPSEAYAGQAVRHITDCGTAGRRETWYLVECEVPLPETATARIIDHHRPGDPGYARGPNNAQWASSLGQVWHLLDVLGIRSADWTEEDRLIAACDHCLGAAYRGECGIDPELVRAHRRRTKAAFLGIAEDEFDRQIEASYARIMAAPMITLEDISEMPHTEDHDWSRSVCDGCMRDPIRVRDLRGLRIPQLVDAACRYDVDYIADGLARPDERKKVVCSGREETVIAFLNTWAEKSNLESLYGDPVRGFAGGYLPVMESKS